ncbi:hypothetical protein ACH5RR_016253, partial [Cinchona calisaya]
TNDMHDTSVHIFSDLGVSFLPLLCYLLIFGKGGERRSNVITADANEPMPFLREIVNQGKLISDEIIINLLSKRLEAGNAKHETEFILDGFPRTIRQAVRFVYIN